MGLIVSKAEPPPPVPDFSAKLAAEVKVEPAADYLNLPLPLKYEDLGREVLMALRPELFEGFRFDFTRPLNGNFFLSHAITMGNIEMPTANRQVIKVPMGTYEFGANVINERFMLLGRITNDGRLSGRVMANVRDWMTAKLQCQLSNEQGGSQVMGDVDLKGKDWQAQLKVGNPGFYGANYFQSVTPRLSLGGEIFWLASSLKSGCGVAARWADSTQVFTAQVATTGILNCQYANKVTDKVTIASELFYNWGNREATAAVGYDAILRQCRIRGKVDSNGVVSTYLEERFSPGVSFLLSAEIDHYQKNYKFGFGVATGE